MSRDARKLSSGFLTKSETNRTVQLQKKPEISDLGSRGIVLSCICVAKTKALISYLVSLQLICPFVVAYVKSRFSHDAAHIIAHVLLNLLNELRKHNMMQGIAEHLIIFFHNNLLNSK